MSAFIKTHTRYRKKIAFFIGILLFFTLVILLNGEEEAVNQTTVEITYIGNEGFLLAGDGKKVAIDSFFSGFKGSYMIPQKTRNLMVKARPPFDNIDLVLCTHMHGDHADQELLGKYLKKDKKAVFLSTRELVDDMPSMIYDFSKIKNRVRGIDLKEGESKVETFKGIRVEVIRLRHGKNMMLHFGFIIEIGNRKILHMGDSSGKPEVVVNELKAYGFPGRRIDIAFIPYWYLMKSEYAKIIKQLIKAEHIIPMHVAVIGFGQTISGILDQIKTHFPQAIIFSKEMEKKTL